MGRQLLWVGTSVMVMQVPSIKDSSITQIRVSRSGESLPFAGGVKSSGVPLGGTLQTMGI